jgi:hypothetical protein
VPAAQNLGVGLRRSCREKTFSGILDAMARITALSDHIGAVCYSDPPFFYKHFFFLRHKKGSNILVSHHQITDITFNPAAYSAESKREES